jgi:hypothetical protein
MPASHPGRTVLLHRSKLFASHSFNEWLTSIRELGKEAEAHAEATEVLRLNPNFSLEVHKQRAPIKDPAVLERHIAALRKAGLK